ncbi:MAG TPA: hypothetical protein VFK48_03650 [Usitatibacter sp.]|nr:hypothetical protein [Usitatibacter sp.]
MAKPLVNPQFQRPEGRAEFDKARNALKSTLLDGDFDAGATRLLDLGAALDVGVARLKRDLLGSALCWNEDNQRVTAWIHQQHRKVTEMGMRLVEAMRRERPAPVLLPNVIALTLHHWGEGLKWVAGRERQDYEPLHMLLELAIAENRHREGMTFVADGRGRCVTIEALYFRALLLDRFGSGIMTRQQIEVLDAWLWEWADSLHGEESHPGGAALRVDLDADAGMRDGPREGEGRSLYLPLAPLEAKRREIVRELHRGRIVPAHGCTAEFRIEEHVAVLDHLQRALRLPETAARRAKRQAAPGTRIEVWVGIADILARGAGIKVGTETGRWRALSLADPSISTDPADQGRPVRYESADPSRRYLWLADTSATGCGFEALESDANGLEIGDLIGWRRAAGGAIALGRIIRRLPSATAGQVFIGVQLFTETGIPFTLSRMDCYDRGRAEETFLFVPGDDESGRRDAFLVSESAFQQQHVYVARVGEDAFPLRFNRVRAKGRGWMLAGFEIVPVRRQAPVEALPDDGEAPGAEPSFELVLDEEGAGAGDDPWQYEVSPKLMA